MTADAAATLTAWATVATAFFTALLFGGVFFAARAYRAQVRSSRVTETGALLAQWREDEIWAARSYADETDDHDENRKRALRFYNHVHGMKRRFRQLYFTVDDALQEIGVLAERTEIYLRKGVADEAIIIEHLGYDIVAPYYQYQDVLQRRAATENLDYEGWRSLVLRVQDYAKVHPKESNLEAKLVWADIPPIRYKDGQVSDPHKAPFWRAQRLRFVRPKPPPDATPR